MHVSYTVDSTAMLSQSPGTISISDEMSGNSSLSGNQDNTIDFTTINGAFTIVPAVVVPEPASVVSSLVGLALVAAVGVRRARRMGIVRP